MDTDAKRLDFGGERQQGIKEGSDLGPEQPRDVPTDILGIQVETDLNPTCVTRASAGHTPWSTRPGLRVKFSCGPRKAATSYSAYNLWKMH